MSTEEGRGVYDDEGRLAKCKDEEVMRGGKSKDKEGGGEKSVRMSFRAYSIYPNIT